MKSSTFWISEIGLTVERGCTQAGIPISARSRCSWQDPHAVRYAAGCLHDTIPIAGLETAYFAMEEQSIRDRDVSRENWDFGNGSLLCYPLMPESKEGKRAPV